MVVTFGISTITSSDSLYLPDVVEVVDVAAPVQAVVVVEVVLGISTITSTGEEGLE